MNDRCCSSFELVWPNQTTKKYICAVHISGLKRKAVSQHDMELKKGRQHGNDFQARALIG